MQSAKDEFAHTAAVTGVGAFLQHGDVPASEILPAVATMEDSPTQTVRRASISFWNVWLCPVKALSKLAWMLNIIGNGGDY